MQVSLMDRAGRRPLLLYPMAVMVLVLGVITAAIKYQVFTLLYYFFVETFHLDFLAVLLLVHFFSSLS